MARTLRVHPAAVLIAALVAANLLGIARRDHRRAVPRHPSRCWAGTPCARCSTSILARRGEASAPTQQQGVDETTLQQLLQSLSTKRKEEVKPKKEKRMNNNNNEPKTETIAETDNFLAWKADEPDGETTYHIELNNVTVHFFEEEWNEFLQLVRNLE